MESFQEFFKLCSGHSPFQFQTEFHNDKSAFKILAVPTGLGKTQTVLSDWLYSRPTRRLIYCLPGRTLTKQISGVAQRMVDNAKLGATVTVLELMGGSSNLDLPISPNCYTIIVGTQDILVSRALNRGYASSPFHWPMDFALFNNDVTWVLDEVQLLGDALATSCQLAGFRESLGAFGKCSSVWMSATFNESWLETVDFKDQEPSLTALTEIDLQSPDVLRRVEASKTVQESPECETPSGCAAFADAKHRPGTLTLIVSNTVKRAREVWEELRKIGRTDVRLLHSRFRPCDRLKAIEELLGLTEGIVVSTQVIEAGVDIDAEMMITDIAPWPSLVQRFGRVNRRGDKHNSHIFWVARPLHSKAKSTDETVFEPYSEEEISVARQRLTTLASASPSSLPPFSSPPPYKFVVRKSDLLDLFDTTPDLAGNYLDVSRFVRSGEETNVYVAWRNWDSSSNAGPPTGMQHLEKQELCPVAISKELYKLIEDRGAWYWDFAGRGSWRCVVKEGICPGMQIVCHADSGGYELQVGWSPGSKMAVPTCVLEASEDGEEASDDNQRSYGPSQTLESHTNDVAAKLNEYIGDLSPLLGDQHIRQLRIAARYHDWGKAHPVFQRTMHAGADNSDVVLAKSETNRRHSVPWFRHEFASALAMISRKMDVLAIYMVAAHHGKVRLNLRSMPGEKPENGIAAIRGVKDGDELLAAPLGEGIVELPTKLDISVAELGLDAEGNPSWTDRMFEILEGLGPFRLAYLEMLVRSADQQASREARLAK